ncbi:MAG TPA: hypothetical protein VMT15_00155 [Bryobacteraceae bacterium]|nr:hypothetical protein [Bryobacteraceae bacterium]
MKPWLLCVALLLFPDLGRAGDLPSTHRSIEDTACGAALKSWKISLAPMVASQTLDAASSYGMRELNPLLASSNGGFEAKALSIKLGVAATAVGVEYLIVRKHSGAARTLARLNWTTGIVTTGFAVHNFAIK